MNEEKTIEGLPKVGGVQKVNAPVQLELFDWKDDEPVEQVSGKREEA